MLKQKKTGDCVNVLIRGGGFSNKGDQAMGISVKQQLALRLKDLTTVTNMVPLADVNECWSSGYAASTIAVGKSKKLLKSVSAIVTDPTLVRDFLLSPLSAIEIAQVPPSVAVLDLGGFAYGDAWGVTALKRALAWAERCHRERIPFVLMPQAWGPFEIPSVRGLAKRLVDLSTLVYARDQKSLKHIQVQLDPRVEVRRAPDIVFSLKGFSSERGKALLKYHGIDVDSGMLVGISPNMRVFERASGSGFSNDYVRYLANLGRFCIENLGVRVVLIPHEKMGRGKNKPDDAYACSLVESLIDSKECCVVLQGLDTPELTKSVMENLDMVIASRFHVAVLALSSSVPVITIGWAHKYEELLAEFDLSDANLNIIEQNVEEAKLVVKSIWERREEYSDSISSKLPSIFGEVSKMFDEVVMVIEEGL